MTEERIRELTKGMLRKKLYVVLSKGGAAPEQIARHLPEHLEYMIDLEKKGVLFASGPLADADGKTRGDGLTVLRAGSPRPILSWPMGCAASICGSGRSWKVRSASR
jgi:uncharacterized protein YciI